MSSSSPVSLSELLDRFPCGRLVDIGGPFCLSPREPLVKADCPSSGRLTESPVSASCCRWHLPWFPPVRVEGEGGHTTIAQGP